MKVQEVLNFLDNCHPADDDWRDPRFYLLHELFNVAGYPQEDWGKAN